MNKRIVLHVRLRCGSLSNTTPVSLPENEFDVRNVLHGQVSLAAINQIYVIHEAMNGCKNLKILCITQRELTTGFQIIFIALHTISTQVSDTGK